MSALAALALVGGLVSTVAAHGYVSGVVIGGKYYQGYDPSFSYQDPPPVVIGWTTTVTDTGFVAPDAFSDPDIICHRGATPAGTSATVAAGGKVELQWTVWPDSHHGPVLDYLAKCSGKCEDADKESLDFFKIDAGGLISATPSPGTWASDDLIAANNSWTVTIPSSIAPGNYVLRHEIIALHSAGNADGAQSYPQCINLKVTGSGSDTPTGEPATEFYTADDPGILVDIYYGLTKYEIPGPSVYGGGDSGSPAPSSAPAPAPTSSAAPISASAPAPSSSSASVPAPINDSASYIPSSSAAAVSTSSAVYAPSSVAASSTKCTTRITISSSAVASSTAGAVTGSSSYPAVTLSAPAGPVGSAPAGYPAPSSLTAPISASSSYPAIQTGGLPSGGLPSGGLPSGGIPSSAPASSTYAIPTISASAPGSYPTGTTPPPPAGGDVDYESLMAKLIAMIKKMFRQAEHGRDFKKF